jgi:hypothetical protein
VLYVAGFVQLRSDAKGRRSYRRRLADGKTSMEAMRCLRRRLSDVVYRQLVRDARAKTLRNAGPRGLGGACFIQRGRPHPGHRPFGSATSRTRPNDATPGHHNREDIGSGNWRPTTAARRRCQRTAPHRTNDVDTDKRRRIAVSRADQPLTTAS